MDIDLTKHKKRAQAAWDGRSNWDGLIGDAYDYAIPHRRPGGKGSINQNADRLFDMTAPSGTMHFAGNLQRDLFPSGQPPFTLKTGPVASMALGAKEISAFDRVLENQAKRVHPFFLAGDWDTAIHECCIDLSVGTGAILPVKGTRDDPLHFAALPIDQIAIITDAYGRVILVSWKQVIKWEQLIDAFPNGNFTDEQRKLAITHPSSDVTLYQDFYQLPGGRRKGWVFVAYVDNSTAPIEFERYRTQPIAVPRYYRVAGESYGRGVVLTALPSIKTVNKAQEIALKAAAIQMLGIWGYRAGGTFNPDTVRVGAGEFWAMQSTGGVLGPDVQRIDSGGARMDVARMVIGGLQDQIREALLDTRLPDYQGTPRAASEIAARLRQRSEVHIGAYGRLVREIMPVVVPRAIEILSDFGYMTMPMTVDELLVSLEVQSPMAAALNADRLASIANYLEFVGAIAGPERVELYANIDKIVEQVGTGLQIDKSLIPDDDQKKNIMDEIERRKSAQLLEIFAQKTAETAPAMIGKAIDASSGAIAA